MGDEITARYMNQLKHSNLKYQAKDADSETFLVRGPNSVLELDRIKV